MPQHHMVIPHYLGENKEMETESKNVKDNNKGIERQGSFSSDSSLQDIPLLLPQEAEGMDASDGDHRLNGMNYSHNSSHPNRVSRSISFPFRKSKVEPVISDMPMKGFVDDRDTLNLRLKVSSDVVAIPETKASDVEWWENQEQCDQDGFTDDSGQVGPRTSCHCQVGCD